MTGRLLCLLLMLCLIFGQTGCAGTADNDAPGFAVFKERTDKTVRSNIETLWRKSDQALLTSLTLQVEDGVVTIAGGVGSEQDRIMALRDVWDAEGVREVVNEIRVLDTTNKSLARDNVAAIKLRTRLTFDPAIISTDYSIEVAGNTVYLMGRAQSKDELDRVMTYANSMPSVDKVVSYVKIRR
jgi:osmotically-inducible protein OsmY